jgi:CubicO group peptidase (beta-lactamase class C family)
LFDDAAKRNLSGGVEVNLDSRAYDFIPEGYPLSDQRKKRITIRHLLSMTSGIPGEKMGVIGMPTATWDGPFEHALGCCPNRYGRWVGQLCGEPGTVWDYSDPAIAHLSLIFARAAGEEISAFMQRRVFGPIGVENVSWDSQGGSGFIGPHTNAHTGVHISARDLARFGYLALQHGQWGNEQLISAAWMDLATHSSQSLNPSYGYTWWVNPGKCRWPNLPEDTFALSGYRSNRCYIIPSLDLVVARVGSGPATWDEEGLIAPIAGAVL